MEGKFVRLAEAFLRAATEGGLNTDDISEIAGQEIGGDINCYPGVPSDSCHQVAVFISLHGKLRKGKRWPYNFSKILQAIIQHMSTCANITKDIVLITDSWWATDFENWQGNINGIMKRGVNLEVYLIGYPNIIERLKIA